jgi:hypothetical protein
LLSAPEEIFNLIFEILDVPSLILVSETCWTLRKLYFRSRRDLLYDSRMDSLGLTRLPTMFGQRQGSSSSSMTPSLQGRQTIRFPEILKIRLPWYKPENVSFARVVSMHIEPSPKTPHLDDRRSPSCNAWRSLVAILSQDLFNLKRLSLSRVIIFQAVFDRLVELDPEELLLASCTWEDGFFPNGEPFLHGPSFISGPLRVQENSRGRSYEEMVSS